MKLHWLALVVVLALAVPFGARWVQQASTAPGPATGYVGGRVLASQPAADAGALFADDFATPPLDEAGWVRTKRNDFEQAIEEVADGRLRLAAATIGTDDATVKFHGVRTKLPVVDLAAPVEVAFDLDWSKQANGCYMTAGVFLCPTESENPREEPDYLKLEYIGVPPGKNARCEVTVKSAGREAYLLTEGWPGEQRTGREIGLQKVRLRIDGAKLTVTENDKTILETDQANLGTDPLYLYLQHSSHSNYRLREVFFDNVRVAR
jgi:hypothetical protein